MKFRYFMGLGKFRHNILSLHYWIFNVFWDLEIFMQGTQMVRNDYYPNYIENFIVFWDLENLA